MSQPGDPQSLNRYSYVNNNPLRYTDPTGNYLFEDEPGDSFFVSPGNSPTGEPMVIAEPCHVGDCHAADSGDLLMVVALPLWAGTGGVAAEALVFDVAPWAGESIGEIASAGWSRFIRLLGLGGSAACADGDCTNEGSSVVDFARSLQGSDQYLGVDQFSETVLHEGDVVVGGLPGQSYFCTTAESLRRAAGSAEALWNGLQVAEHTEMGYRTVVGVYRVVTDVTAATGQALANPQHGTGGFVQFVIENYSRVLELLYTVTLR